MCACIPVGFGSFCPLTSQRVGRGNFKSSVSPKTGHNASLSCCIIMGIHWDESSDRKYLPFRPWCLNYGFDSRTSQSYQHAPDLCAIPELKSPGWTTKHRASHTSVCLLRWNLLTTFALRKCTARSAVNSPAANKHQESRPTKGYFQKASEFPGIFSCNVLPRKLVNFSIAAIQLSRGPRVAATEANCVGL